MSNKFIPLDWVKSTNVYEVNVRQYTVEGTFNAFAKALPRLKDMGVETLWFMPITPIAKKEMKGTIGSPYACSDYTSINHEFGTLEDFKRLVDTAHGMGFKIIIDWVANHTGWDHVWTVSNPAYFKRDEATNDFKRASGMDDIIELDYNNPALRKAMIGAMKFWVEETNIDGFRCDLATWVQVDFWEEARPQVDAIKPLFWLGEFDQIDNPDYKPVFDCSYAWKWMHETEAFYKNNLGMEVLDDLLIKYDITVRDSMNLWFTSNHDENSWNGTEYEKYGDMAKVLAVFSFAWNGIPLIYSGQELPNMKRLQFFDKDVIEWDGSYQLHDFYKALNAIKKINPALRAGDPAVTTYRLQTRQRNLLAWLRKNGPHEILVILNFGNQAIKLELSARIVSGSYRNVFNGSVIDLTGSTEFELAPWGFLLFEKQYSDQ